jgi:hypothetical protein
LAMFTALVARGSIQFVVSHNNPPNLSWKA